MSLFLFCLFSSSTQAPDRPTYGLAVLEDTPAGTPLGLYVGTLRDQAEFIGSGMYSYFIEGKNINR